MKSFADYSVVVESIDSKMTAHLNYVSWNCSSMVPHEVCYWMSAEWSFVEAGIEAGKNQFVAVDCWNAKAVGSRDPEMSSCSVDGLIRFPDVNSETDPIEIVLMEQSSVANCWNYCFGSMMSCYLIVSGQSTECSAAFWIVAGVPRSAVAVRSVELTIAIGSGSNHCFETSWSLNSAVAVSSLRSANASRSTETNFDQLTEFVVSFDVGSPILSFVATENCFGGFPAVLSMTIRTSRETADQIPVVDRVMSSDVVARTLDSERQLVEQLRFAHADCSSTVAMKSFRFPIRVHGSIHYSDFEWHPVDRGHPKQLDCSNPILDELLDSRRGDCRHESHVTERYRVRFPDRCEVDRHDSVGLLQFALEASPYRIDRECWHSVNQNGLSIHDLNLRVIGDQDQEIRLSIRVDHELRSGGLELNSN